MVEMVENPIILSSEVSSQMNADVSERLCSFKSTFNTENNSVPLTEAEINQQLEDIGRPGNYSDSDIRYFPAALNHMSGLLRSFCLQNGCTSKYCLLFVNIRSYS
jgi:hypothetical protein